MANPTLDAARKFLRRRIPCEDMAVQLRDAYEDFEWTGEELGDTPSPEHVAVVSGTRQLIREYCERLGVRDTP